MRDCSTCKFHVQGRSLAESPAHCHDCLSFVQGGKPVLPYYIPKWEGEQPKEVVLIKPIRCEISEGEERPVDPTLPAPSFYTAPQAHGPAPTAGGTKYDDGKPGMHLLDHIALREIAKVLDFGAKKYAPNNWRKGIAMSRLLAAALRHLFAYASGERKDPESGLSHLAHAGCCVVFALNMEQTRPDLNDVYTGVA